MRRPQAGASWTAPRSRPRRGRGGRRSRPPRPSRSTRSRPPSRRRARTPTARDPTGYLRRLQPRDVGPVAERARGTHRERRADPRRRAVFTTPTPKIPTVPLARYPVASPTGSPSAHATNMRTRSSSSMRRPTNRSATSAGVRTSPSRPRGPRRDRSGVAPDGSRSLSSSGVGISSMGTAIAGHRSTLRSPVLRTAASTAGWRPTSISIPKNGWPRERKTSRAASIAATGSAGSRIARSVELGCREVAPARRADPGPPGPHRPRRPRREYARPPTPHRRRAPRGPSAHAPTQLPCPDAADRCARGGLRRDRVPARCGRRPRGALRRRSERTGELGELDRAFDAGEIGLRDVLVAEAASLQGTRDELIAFALDHCPLDPTFAGFAAWAEERELPITTSPTASGYIRPLLEASGLGPYRRHERLADGRRCRSERRTICVGAAR